MIAGQRQADGDLAVLGLAQLPAVLPSDADRVLALLRYPGVVNETPRSTPSTGSMIEHTSASTAPSDQADLATTRELLAPDSQMVKI